MSDQKKKTASIKFINKYYEVYADDIQVQCCMRCLDGKSVESVLSCTSRSTRSGQCLRHVCVRLLHRLQYLHADSWTSVAVEKMNTRSR